MARKRIGLFVMSTGIPDNQVEIEQYAKSLDDSLKEKVMTNITNKYKELAHTSPIKDTTNKQAKNLAEMLNDIQDILQFKAYVGFGHTNPSIKDTIEQMNDDGIEKAITIVLEPHRSTYQVQSCVKEARSVAEKIGGPELDIIEAWNDTPGFIDYWVEQIEDIVDNLSDEACEKTMFVFTAQNQGREHEQELASYVEEVKQTVTLITDELDVINHDIAWQDVTTTESLLLTPDVCAKTKELCEKKYESIVFVPVGFTTDCLTVLFDNDITCKAICDKYGINYTRLNLPNTHADFIEALAGVILDESKSEMFV